MSHDHSHNHSAVPLTRLWIALLINFVFLIVELIGGLWSGSLALLSDAGHMFTDVGALGLAVFVVYLGMKPPDLRRSYGYKRAEIIGAFLNGASLVAICGIILWEAYRRLDQVQNILAIPTLIIAVTGLAANLISALILAKSQHDNLNIRGAYLHLMYDALGSVGAVISGLVLWLWQWYWIDILASVFIVLLILMGAIPLLKQSINMLLDAVPDHIDYRTVEHALSALPHVNAVHDLHIWSIHENKTALSVHLQLTAECTDAQHWKICLQRVQEMLKAQFQIEHSTVQIEPGKFVHHEHCDTLDNHPHN